jgi:hypothetical protein
MAARTIIIDIVIVVDQRGKSKAAIATETTAQRPIFACT